MASIGESIMKTKPSHVFYSPALRYFVEVAKVGSIRGAARDLNVVSSAVNRQILNLEQQFGLQLFDRVGRGIKLSEAGQVLLVHAKRALRDFDSALEALDDLSGLRRGVVHVGIVESIADTLMTHVVSKFQQKYPGIQVNISINSSQQVMQDITAAKVHVALGFNAPNHEELNHESSQTLTIGAVVAPNHPLTKQSVCTLEDCLQHPVAVPSSDLSIGNIMANAISASGIKPKTLIKTNSLRFMKSLAMESDYVAFQTRLGMEADRQAGKLVFIPISNSDFPQDKLVLVTNNTHELSLAPTVFLKHLHEALDHFAELED